MDFTSSPTNSTFLLMTPFFMPTVDRGDRWAISCSGYSKILVSGALSFAVAWSFLLLWKLICRATELIPPGRVNANDNGNDNDNSQLSIVARMLQKSKDPWTVCEMILRRTYKRIYDTFDFRWVDGLKKKYQVWNDLITHREEEELRLPHSLDQEGPVFITVAGIIALAVVLGSIVMGIITSPLMEIGNVAPVRPSILFLPDPNLEVTDSHFIKDIGLRSPAFMRAMGNVDANWGELTSRVNFTPVDLGHYSGANANTNDNRTDDPIIRLYYDYSLSGAELGLRGGDRLTLKVSGACITDYNWFNSSDGQTDWYNIWNESDDLFPLFFGNNPSNALSISLLTGNEGADTSNKTFAIFVSTAHQLSTTKGTDPWYATENHPDQVSYLVKNQRPVLSCWEQDLWDYGGLSVESVYDLKNVTSMEIPEVLLEVLEGILFLPIIVWIGFVNGASALRTSLTALGYFDAAESSMEKDVRRLVLAGFLATKNIFVDATFNEHLANTKEINIFRNNATKELKVGAGDFVVSGPDIQTISMTGLVTLMAVLVALILANFALALVLACRRQPNARSEYVEMQDMIVK